MSSADNLALMNHNRPHRHVAVTRGQARGELRQNVSARLAATTFLAAAAAILSGTVYAEGEATPEEIRNQLLHAVLHGLIEPKPRLKWRRPEGNRA